MKTKNVSFILAALIAAPRSYAGLRCENIFVTREIRTENTVFEALDEVQSLFKLSERHLEKIRTKIRYEMETKSPSEKLRLARVLNVVDKVLESRWLLWEDLVNLDETALTRRIVTQEKVMIDLSRDLESSGDFETPKTSNPLTHGQLFLAKSPNFRRVVASFALNSAYFLGMIHFVGITPATPVRLPVLRLRLPPRAIDRFNELRAQKFSVEKAADVVKAEYPGAIYGQASLKWSVVMFSTIALVYAISVAWNSRDKKLASLLPFSHDILKQAIKAQGALRELAKQYLSAMKNYLETELKKESEKKRRKEIEEQLKSVNEDLKEMKDGFFAL